MIMIVGQLGLEGCLSVLSFISLFYHYYNINIIVLSLISHILTLISLISLINIINIPYDIILSLISHILTLSEKTILSKKFTCSVSRAACRRNRFSLSARLFGCPCRADSNMLILLPCESKISRKFFFQKNLAKFSLCPCRAA
jgi:hypothetical protein